jgi:formyl-CoA transferase
VEHPSAGTLPLVASPFGDVRAPEPPPLLGEHTAGVLRECGYDDDEIAALAGTGAIELA